MSIESLLDGDGRGVLTQELDRIFTVGGCRPMCHVCQTDLEVEKPFRLKPFAVERSKSDTKKSLDIMTCNACDKDNKKLPYKEFFKALASLGFDVPERVETKLPTALDYKRDWRRNNLDANSYEFRRQGWGNWDDTYIDASLKYEAAVKKFHKKYEQLFENESYDERSTVKREEDRKYFKNLQAKSARSGGGCFILKTGGQSKIIGGDLL